jgi:hypothetical protein
MNRFSRIRQWLASSRRRQLLAASVLSGAAALAGLAIYVASGGGGGGAPGPEVGMRASPTASATSIRSPSPRATGAPAATPAPELLAFIRDGDIWLINADGSGERKLTSLGDVQSVSWLSSDELYAVTYSGAAQGHLLADPEGNLRRLSSPTGGSWSRDAGLYVVLEDKEIAVYRRDGSEDARLQTGLLNPFEEAFKEECAEPLLVFGQPIFSPNGQALLVPISCQVLEGSGGLAAPIYEVTLEGNVKGRVDLQPVNVEFGPASPGRISPDGTRIAQEYGWKSGLCPPQSYLSVSDARGGERHDLTLRAIAEVQQQQPRGQAFGGPGGFDWSPKSDAIVVSFDVGLCDLDAEAEQQFRALLAGLYILEADGSGEEKLVDGPTSFHAWSSSGQFIAYVVPSDTPIIRLFDLTTRQTTELTQGGSPAWQPQP